MHNSRDVRVKTEEGVKELDKYASLFRDLRRRFPVWHDEKGKGNRSSKKERTGQSGWEGLNLARAFEGLENNFIRG